MRVVMQQGNHLALILANGRQDRPDPSNRRSRSDRVENRLQRVPVNLAEFFAMSEYPIGNGGSIGDRIANGNMGNSG